MTVRLENYELRRSAAPAVPRTGVLAPERFRPRVPARRRPPSGSVSPRALLALPDRGGCVDPVEQPSGGYRIGRWARLTITISVLVVGLLFATGALPIGAASDSVATAHVTVRAGDTLWSIAASAAGDGNVAEVVERIRQLNELDRLGRGAALPVGLELEVPAG